MKKIPCIAVFFMLLLFINCNNIKKEESSSTKNSTTTSQFNDIQKRLSISKKLLPETKLKGVVELGATGFNLFIISLDSTKTWQLKHKEFGMSLIAESLTTVKGVEATLKAYNEKAKSLGVTSENIHFVVSSGALKEEITKQINSALEGLGYTVNEVSAEKEATLVLKTVIPNSFNKTAHVVDIGSRNTKISFVKDSTIVTNETHGAKYFQKQLQDSIVYKEVKKSLQMIPSTKREQCFIIGGIAYQMAKEYRKENERYTLLSKNVDTYKNILAFSSRKNTAGLNIFKAILDETHSETIIFDWDANFSIGFLLELPY